MRCLKELGHLRTQTSIMFPETQLQGDGLGGWLWGAVTRLAHSLPRGICLSLSNRHSLTPGLHDGSARGQAQGYSGMEVTHN